MTAPSRPAALGTVIVLAEQPMPGRAKTHLTSFDASRYGARLGLATDGGYWAIGLADPGMASTAIAGVPMSTEDTGSIQLARLRGAGLRVQLLDELSDFDSFDAACAIVDQAPHGALAATMRGLRAVR